MGLPFKRFGLGCVEAEGPQEPLFEGSLKPKSYRTYFEVQGKKGLLDSPIVEPCRLSGLGDVLSPLAQKRKLEDALFKSLRKDIP